MLRPLGLCLGRLGSGLRAYRLAVKGIVAKPRCALAYESREFSPEVVTHLWKDNDRQFCIGGSWGHGQSYVAVASLLLTLSLQNASVTVSGPLAW